MRTEISYEATYFDIEVKSIWIKGHSNIEHNDNVDLIAKEACTLTSTRDIMPFKDDQSLISDYNLIAKEH